jgi:hypothetical protein
MRKVPDDNLSYPVLVSTGISSGSGFYLNTGAHAVFVTANHVINAPGTQTPISNDVHLSSFALDPADNEKIELQLDLRAMSAAGLVRVDTARDICVCRIGSGGSIATNSGVKVLSARPSGLVSVGPSTVRLYKDVLVSNEVYIFGYPVSLGMKHQAQIDFSKPLLRSGIVAGKNDNRRAIVLDCAAYPGNSGGPVLEVEQEAASFRYRIIGVVTEFVPTLAPVLGSQSESFVASNSGYALAASMDDVLGLVEQF